MGDRRRFRKLKRMDADGTARKSTRGFLYWWCVLLCGVCGNKVQNSVQDATISAVVGECPKCGHPRMEGDIFCNNCGARLDDEDDHEDVNTNIAADNVAMSEEATVKTQSND